MQADSDRLGDDSLSDDRWQTQPMSRNNAQTTTPVSAPERDPRWIVDQTMWELSDVTMTVRAAARVAAAAGLVALGIEADVSGAALAAFVLLLFANGVSLLHARRKWNEQFATTLSERFAMLGRAWSTFFPYPRHPHVNAVGFLEVGSMLLVAVAIGHLGGSVFAGQPLRFALAVVLITVNYSTALANVIAHVVWITHRGPHEPQWKPMDVLFSQHRRKYGPAVMFLAGLLLWPDPTAPDILRWTVAVSVLAGTVAAEVSFVMMQHRADRIMQITRPLRAGVRYDDGRVVHAELKSAWRAARHAMPKNASDQAVKSMRVLGEAIDTLQEALEADRIVMYPTVNYRIRSLSQSVPDWGRYADCVVEGGDLNLSTLHPDDADLVLTIVADQFTNFTKANAVSPTISLREGHDDNGRPNLRIDVYCDCSLNFDPEALPRNSSLLATFLAVQHRGGTPQVIRHGTAEQFVFAWPTSEAWGTPPADQGNSHDR